MAVQPAPLGKTLSTAELQRYHAFDSLRAAMMLLGLVIHSAMEYVTFPTDRVWPFKDPHPSAVFDLLVTFIHTFRMPVFFVIAGFFAAFLYTTRGRATGVGCGSSLAGCGWEQARASRGTKKASGLARGKTAVGDGWRRDTIVGEIRRSAAAAVDELWRFVQHKGQHRGWGHAREPLTGGVVAYTFGSRADEVFVALPQVLKPFGLEPFSTAAAGL